MSGYLIGIIAAALVCGIVEKLLGDKGAIGLMGRLLCGVFLVLTFLSPLKSVRLRNLNLRTNDYAQAVEEARDDGAELAQSALADGIKQRTEAYILDKAAGMDVALSVEVTLDESQIPMPESVRLTGAVSPYAKQRLTNIIQEDLGIDKEHQIWT